VWQYGSNPDNPFKWQQDGVAAQCNDEENGLPITNKVYIEDQPSTPELEAIKNFNEAHYSENYWWIFNILKDRDGYVKTRN
jgi:hypothetical protein